MASRHGGTFPVAGETELGAVIYIAIELSRPTLALVRAAIKDAADNFDELANEADFEESRWPDRTRLRTDSDSLHIKGQRQIEFRAKASALREFSMQLAT